MSRLLIITAIAAAAATSALAQPNMSPAEMQARIVADFKAQDTDNDGRLSKAEHAAAAPPVMKASVDRNFTSRDADKDGFLSFEEFKAPVHGNAGRAD